jgi:hypothetical protein
MDKGMVYIPGVMGHWAQDFVMLLRMVVCNLKLMNSLALEFSTDCFLDDG